MCSSLILDALVMLVIFVIIIVTCLSEGKKSVYIVGGIDNCSFDGVWSRTMYV